MAALPDPRKDPRLAGQEIPDEELTGRRPITYRNDSSGRLGGDWPEYVGCYDWSWGNRTPTADCVGLACWAAGISRNQPGFDGISGPWLHGPSILADASTERRFFEYAGDATARPGDWAVSRDHVAIIVRPDYNGEHLVVDCSPSNRRDRAVDTSYIWDGASVCRPLWYDEA